MDDDLAADHVYLRGRKAILRYLADRGVPISVPTLHRLVRTGFPASRAVHLGLLARKDEIDRWIEAQKEDR